MQNKLHNRTIFVAALSVYLGLLVVGAPPQVLAQTTAIVESKIKQYQQNISFENLPDFAETVKQFAREAENFSAQPLKVFATHSFTTGCRHSLSGAEPFEFLQSPNASPDVGSEFLGGLSRAGAFGYVGLPRQAVHVAFNFESNEAFLNSKAEFSQRTAEDAQQFVWLYKTAWENWKTEKQNSPEAVIYENTEIFAENNQVFIVTRLPRGSLDSLLKANEKAN